jgi:4-amino-4-deoxy-L-arabinose transferase-like glycosyltransferase
MPEQLRHGVVIAAIGAVLFQTGLGATHLWDDDETFFAEAAREMFERGDAVVPWFNGELFAHKPPFMYWMMMGAYKLFGVNEFAARLPSALFGIATALLVWQFGRLLYSAAVGFWAGVILVTSLNFVVISRAAAADAELAFFCTLPLYIFARATRLRREGIGNETCAKLLPGRRTMMIVYAAMGVATLVKGPIGCVLPTAVLGLYLLLATVPDARASQANRPRWLSWPAALWRTFSPARLAAATWQLRPLTAVAAILLVAGPWYVAVSWQTDGAFLDGFFGVHNFGRFLKPMENHRGPMVYYVAAICVGFFPWSLFLTPTVQQLIARIRETGRWKEADLFVCSWFAVWVGFFSVASTKFPHYIIPAYPAMALLTACFVVRWIAEPEIYRTWLRRSAWITCAVVGVGIAVVLPIVSSIYLPGEELIGLIGVELVVAAAVLWRLTEQGRIRAGVCTMTATGVAFFLSIFCYAAVRIDRHQNHELFANAYRTAAENRPVRIVTNEYFRPGLVFYFRRPVEQLWGNEKVAEAFRDGAADTLLLTREERLPELRQVLPDDVQEIERSPWFLKSGQTLVLLGRRHVVERVAAQEPAIR